MQKLIKTSEELLLRTPRMDCVKVNFSNEEGKSVINHIIIKSNPSVGIIIFKDKKIALIKQFRSTTGQNYIEIPAGIIEDGETEEEAAIREAREETGIVIEGASSLVKGPSLLDISKSDENYGVVVAKAYEQREQKLDETEQIDSEIIWMEEKDVFDRIKAQMFKGEPFMDNLFMSGYSIYAFMAYILYQNKL